MGGQGLVRSIGQQSVKSFGKTRSLRKVVSSLVKQKAKNSQASFYEDTRGDTQWNIRGTLRMVWIGLAAFVIATLPARAQSCETGSDLDDATRTAITTAGKRYFDMAAKGDTSSLRQNSIGSLASDFSGVESSVKDQQQNLSGALAAVKSVFLLETQGDAAQPHAEFDCGIFGKSGQTSNSSVFYLDNLPPGKYAVVLFEAAGAKEKENLSLILQQAGTDWKVGGLYIQASQVAGHASDWFSSRAREYKAKGQLHNAWFFYLEARTLISPLPFMSTQASDKLYDESQSMQPGDLPANGKTVDLAAGAATYKLTAIFPQAVGDDLDLVVKYQAADISNTNQMYQSNVVLIKALVAKYPEVRDAFAGVVARAVDSSGRDYGTLLAMKDIK
jgi:hypothetical protein